MNLGVSKHLNQMNMKSFWHQEDITACVCDGSGQGSTAKCWRQWIIYPLLRNPWTYNLFQAELKRWSLGIFVQDKQAYSIRVN